MGASEIKGYLIWGPYSEGPTINQGYCIKNPCFRNGPYRSLLGVRIEGTLGDKDPLKQKVPCKRERERERERCRVKKGPL